VEFEEEKQTQIVRSELDDSDENISGATDDSYESEENDAEIEEEVKNVKTGLAKEKKKGRGKMGRGRNRPPTPKEVALKLDDAAQPRQIQALKVHLLLEMRMRGTSPFVCITLKIRNGLKIVYVC
jgi:hypothetical protein